MKADVRGQAQPSAALGQLEASKSDWRETGRTQANVKLNKLHNTLLFQWAVTRLWCALSTSVSISGMVTGRIQASGNAYFMVLTDVGWTCDRNSLYISSNSTIRTSKLQYSRKQNYGPAYGDVTKQFAGCADHRKLTLYNSAHRCGVASVVWDRTGNTCSRDENLMKLSRLTICND